MSLDRFVYFPERRPTRQQVRSILADYLAGAGVIDSSDNERLIVGLVGLPSYPFKSLDNCAAGMYEEHNGRWLEVFIGLDANDKYIDIITRTQDEFTNVVAEGFAALMCRYFEGERGAM
jgi:hypothetical protein